MSALPFEQTAARGICPCCLETVSDGPIVDLFACNACFSAHVSAQYAYWLPLSDRHEEAVILPMMQRWFYELGCTLRARERENAANPYDDDGLFKQRINRGNPRKRFNEREE